MSNNQEYRARVQKVRKANETRGEVQAKKEGRVLQAYTAKDHIVTALAKHENSAQFWAGGAMACALVRALNK
jgi:hypothetical protein